MDASLPHFDIAVVGEINLDLVLDGIPYPMPLERELLATAFQVTLGSSAAILAHNLAALGTRVGFASLAAKDAFSRSALGFLTERKVDISGVQYSDSDSGSGVTVVVNHGGPRHILSYLGTTPELKVGHLDLEHLCRARHFHLSSLFLLKGLHKDLPDLFRKIRQRGVTISLDTNDDPDDVWGGVLGDLLPLIDVLLPNERELLRMTDAVNIEEALAALSGKVPLIVVKRGASGAIVQQGGKRHVVPPVRVVPVDTIGAGDSFNAGFLACYVRGLSAQTCAAAGNVTGAISTLKPGGIEAFRDDAFLRKTVRDLAPDLPLLDRLFQ
jgi:sugar/nucleoside kinase (ribokinase family)